MKKYIGYSSVENAWVEFEHEDVFGFDEVQRGMVYVFDYDKEEIIFGSVREGTVYRDMDMNVIYDGSYVVINVDEPNEQIGVVVYENSGWYVRVTDPFHGKDIKMYSFDRLLGLRTKFKVVRN